MSTELEILVREYEAIQRWNAGETPSFSSDVADFLTCGYGKLNQWGDWEFPLYPARKYAELLKKRLSSCPKERIINT